eukprot:1287867-Rhodomonas_salina.1
MVAAAQKAKVQQRQTWSRMPRGAGHGTHHVFNLLRASRTARAERELRRETRDAKQMRTETSERAPHVADRELRHQDAPTRPLRPKT